MNICLEIEDFNANYPSDVGMVWNEILQSWLDSSSSGTRTSLAQTLTDNDFPHIMQNFSLYRWPQFRGEV